MCNELSEAILEVDAAVHVLEQADHDVVEQEKRTATTRLESRDEFRKGYTERVRAHRASTAGKAKKAKATPPVKKTKLPTVISHAEANNFIPPETSIWRGRVRGSLQGHCKPFARVSVSWSTCSEPEAMKKVIRTLWEEYILGKALDKDACPWDRLLDD